MDSEKFMIKVDLRPLLQDEIGLAVDSDFHVTNDEQIALAMYNASP